MNSQTRAVILVVSVLAAGAAFGQVKGTIVRMNTTEAVGDIKWKQRDKAYEVTTGSLIVEVPLADVQELKIPKPRALTDAERLIREGKVAEAIPILTKVSTDYLMLTWDKPAIRYLADAYLKDGKVDEAIKVCENVIRADPEAAYIGDFAPIYWQALQKKGNNTNKVEDLMAKAIKSGDRTASASALVMRGDLILATGDTSDNAKKALRDGYLRVVALYDKEKMVRPEALYKAAKCFDKIGQTSRAESFRSELKKDFAGTEWATKM